VGPFTVIGSIVYKQYLGPHESIGKLSWSQGWAHSLSSAVLFGSNFWAHVNLSTECLRLKSELIHCHQQYYVQEISGPMQAYRQIVPVTMVGPIALIGNIICEQFLGPCEPINRMPQAIFGPFTVIGSIMYKQFLGPCESIGKLSWSQGWAHSLSLTILCAINFWAHANLSANCRSSNGGPNHSHWQYCLGVISGPM
jgi:hypothetical protein